MEGTRQGTRRHLLLRPLPNARQGMPRPHQDIVLEEPSRAESPTLERTLERQKRFSGPMLHQLERMQGGAQNLLAEAERHAPALHPQFVQPPDCPHGCPTTRTRDAFQPVDAGHRSLVFLPWKAPLLAAQLHRPNEEPDCEAARKATPRAAGSRLSCQSSSPRDW